MRERRRRGVEGETGVGPLQRRERLRGVRPLRRALSAAEREEGVGIKVKTLIVDLLPL